MLCLYLSNFWNRTACGLGVCIALPHLDDLESRYVSIYCFAWGSLAFLEVMAARSSCRVIMGSRFQCECFVLYIENGGPPDGGFRPTPNVACYYI